MKTCAEASPLRIPTVWLVFILSLGLVVAGCGNADPTNVKVTLQTALDGSLLTISGQATVPDGALLDYAIEQIEWDGAVLSDKAAVSDGEYSAEIDLAEFGFEPGKINVWVAFMPLSDAGQPEEVIALFGSAGENLTGRQVTEYGNLKRVEAEKVITLK